jgi:hypothetical protein
MFRSIFLFGKDRVILLFSITLAISVVLIKSQFSISIPNSLWAEDGNVFINQAQNYGILSFFQPYAGYLHIWPRFFAYISSFFELQYAPYLLFLGWFLSCVLAIWSILKFSVRHGFPLYLSAWVSILAMLVPHSDEVYFTVTNAQWFLPVFLLLFLLYGTNENWFITLLIFFVSLTGPFSVLLTPVILMKIFLTKTLSDKKILFAFFAGAIIQFFYLVIFKRSVSVHLQTDPFVWADVFLTFFSFGSEGYFLSFISFGYWLCFGFLIFNFFFNLRKEKIRLFIVIFGVTVFAASLWSIRNDPQSINPLLGGSRYYFIPYMTCIIFCLFSFKENKYASSLSILLFSIICIGLFKDYRRENIYFNEFAVLHEIVGGFVVPIHPMWPSYPSWHISTNPLSRKSVDEADGLLANYYVNDGFLDDGFIYFNNFSDPNILFKDNLTCDSDHVIGLFLEYASEIAGWNQLFWTTDGNFTEGQSFSRFHENGLKKVVYAFPGLEGNISVRFDPPAGTKKIEFEKAYYFCVGE